MIRPKNLVIGIAGRRDFVLSRLPDNLDSDWPELTKTRDLALVLF